MHPAIVILTIPVAIFGIIGNSLVIISIFQRRRSLLTSNYYFLVLHLAICDGIWLALHFVYLMSQLINKNVAHHKTFCLVIETTFMFAEAGSLMMLMISVLRYRATVYPLKPPISKRRIKVSCAMAYVVSLILGYIMSIPSCVDIDDNSVTWKIQTYLVIFGYCFLSTATMAVIYYKVVKELYNQNNIFQISHNRNSVDSSFSKQRYRRNRKITFTCIITVIFYAMGNIPIAISFFVRMNKNYSSSIIFGITRLLRIFATHAVNPLIYGLLDKKLLTFWRNCRKKRANVMLEAPIERNGEHF